MSSAYLFRIVLPSALIAAAGCTDSDPPTGKPNNTRTKPMTQDDAQATWDDYYGRIRARRTSEAKQLFSAMRENGVTDETVLLLDFRHFSSEKGDADNLGKQLAENYDIRITQDIQSNHWFVDGTTRPDGITLTESQCIDWVTFMADVAQSHGCVFSTWRLTDTRNDRSWSNESFEADTD